MKEQARKKMWGKKKREIDTLKRLADWRKKGQERRV